MLPCLVHAGQSARCHHRSSLCVLLDDQLVHVYRSRDMEQTAPLGSLQHSQCDAGRQPGDMLLGGRALDLAATQPGDGAGQARNHPAWDWECRRFLWPKGRQRVLLFIHLLYATWRYLQVSWSCYRKGVVLQPVTGCADKAVMLLTLMAASQMAQCAARACQHARHLSRTAAKCSSWNVLHALGVPVTDGHLQYLQLHAALYHATLQHTR